MISDNLLGTFELNISDAALHDRFSHGSDKKRRPFGGYNLLTFGDLYQIPPIPASAALCIPSADGKSQQERAALNLFWSTNPAEAFNFLAELKVQKRVVGDLWYASFLEECRFGRLSDENYNFLLGLPTLHAGCWPFFKEYQCETPRCRQLLQNEWRELMMRGASWSTCQALECDMCKRKRERRNRVITSGDKRVTQKPFIDAPYMHKNNEPKYHAMLLRAAEHGKKEGKHILWFAAVDEPDNPQQLAKSKERLHERKQKLLQIHDRKTAGIPGITPIFVGLRGRTTEKYVSPKTSSY